MKKLSILPALIVLVIGGVFAATQLFPPSSPEFPSMPKGQGTIGYILSLFGSDGTAPNTERLGGVTASGYLQNNLCDPTKVWTGIDADGKAICGTRQTLLVGNFTEGSMSVKRGTAAAVALTANAPIYEGDLLITNSSQTGTIQFAQDASYIRLDTDTTVEIRTGTLGGNTVAEAILADGQLWGRIMTSTGVNLGGGGLVAGVRGTSVLIGYTRITNNVNISIIDSTKATDAAIITKVGSNTTVATLDPAERLIFASGSTTVAVPQAFEKTTVIEQNPWISANLRSDLAYLSSLSELNNSTESIRAKNEWESTKPQDAVTSKAICQSDNGKYTYPNGKCSEYLAEVKFGNNDKVAGKYVLKTIFGDIVTENNNENSNNNNDGTSISQYNEVIGFPDTNTTNRSAADTSNANKLFASLAGKTMTMELGDEVGKSKLQGQTKFYIADFGDEKWFVTKNAPCAGNVSTTNPQGDFLCRSITGASPSTIKIRNYNNEEEISISISSTPTQMIFGNSLTIVNGIPAYRNPIGTTIKSISIK